MRVPSLALLLASLDACTGLPTDAIAARGGADHIVLNPRSGMTWERYPFCELTLGSAWLGAALYLAMEQAPRNDSRWVC